MVKCESLIAILMATYNGEKYIREQLDSLIAQTCNDWTLYINDDGSTDHTLEIISEYAQQDNRIIVLNLTKHGNACKNFLSLLEAVEAQYYMFCDQDDIWHNDKIVVSLAAMKRIEKEHQPAIVHTDLRMVNANGNTCLAKSFWQFAHIRPEAITKFSNYASTCVATGCTMLFNFAAKKCTVPNPRHARMHDAWVMLCVAKQEGTIHAIDQATIDYRQHAGNTIGAPDSSRYTLLYKLRNLPKVISENLQQYLMLRELGYPGIIVYIKEKIRYHRLS